jgi:hypothetical protein
MTAPKPSKTQQLKASSKFFDLNIARQMFQRVKGMLGGGTMFGGRRDLYAVYGWNPQPTHQNYMHKYRKQDIARRIINQPVRATWSDPPKLTADNAEFETDWAELLTEIPVFAQLQKLDKLCGLGAFAVMVIGLDDGRPLNTPLAPAGQNGTRRKRKVTYLQPYAEGSVNILTWDTNPSSPRYGLPEMYEIDPRGESSFSKVRDTTTSGVSGPDKFNVHWHRVLHIADDALESSVFGASRLEAVYNVLDDIMKVAGGSAETFWLIANRGLHVNIDKEMEISPEDTEQLASEIDEYEHNIRRVIRTRGVDINALGSDVADPRGVFDVQLSLLASATGIPKRVLAGSEAGQLASQQDRANWAVVCAERIAEFAEPVVFLPFIKHLIMASVLPMPVNMRVLWPDAFKMSPLERAQTSAQMARSVANVSKTYVTVAELNIKIAELKQSAKQAKQIQDNIASGVQPSLPFGGGAPTAPGGRPGAGSNRLGPTGARVTAHADNPLNVPDQGPMKSDFTTDSPADEVDYLPDLFTGEELRNIVGFGKHMPTFDDPNEKNASGVGPDAGKPKPTTTTPPTSVN